MRCVGWVKVAEVLGGASQTGRTLRHVAVVNQSRTSDRSPTRIAVCLTHPTFLRSTAVCNSRRVHQAKAGVVQGDLGGKVVPGRSWLIGDECPGTADQGVEEAALAAVGRTGEHDADQFPADAPRGHLFDEAGDLARGRVQPGEQLPRRKRRGVFFGEIEIGLQVGQQVEQFVAKLVERPSQPAGELRQGRAELSGIGGVDDAQNGFRLGEVDASGEKGAEGELAGLSQPRPAAQTVRSNASRSGGEPSVWISATGWPV